MTRHDGSGDRWFDRDAGPVVRPYALTRGRTLPSGGESFDLIDVVVATSDRVPEHFRPGPEHRRLLSLCRRPGHWNQVCFRTATDLAEGNGPDPRVTPWPPNAGERAAANSSESPLAR